MDADIDLSARPLAHYNACAHTHTHTVAVVGAAVTAIGDYDRVRSGRRSKSRRRRWRRWVEGERRRRHINWLSELT